MTVNKNIPNIHAKDQPSSSYPHFIQSAATL